LLLHLFEFCCKYFHHLCFFMVTNLLYYIFLASDKGFGKCFSPRFHYPTKSKGWILFVAKPKGWIPFVASLTSIWCQDYKVAWDRYKVHCLLLTVYLGHLFPTFIPSSHLIFLDTLNFHLGHWPLHEGLCTCSEPWSLCGMYL